MTAPDTDTLETDAALGRLRLSVPVAPLARLCFTQELLCSRAARPCWRWEA